MTGTLGQVSRALNRDDYALVSKGEPLFNNTNTSYRYYKHDIHDFVIL